MYGVNEDCLVQSKYWNEENPDPLTKTLILSVDHLCLEKQSRHIVFLQPMYAFVAQVVQFNDFC